MTASDERRKALSDALESRILVIDGAMGTMLQQQHLTAADFGGPALEGCNEIWRPAPISSKRIRSTGPRATWWIMA